MIILFFRGVEKRSSGLVTELLMWRAFKLLAGDIGRPCCLTPSAIQHHPLLPPSAAAAGAVLAQWSPRGLPRSEQANLNKIGDQVKTADTEQSATAAVVLWVCCCCCAGAGPGVGV